MTPKTIQELLRIKGMSQPELAAAIGTSQGTISKWATGVHEPPKDAWDKIMRYALSDPRTAHLAYDYITNLVGKDTDGLIGLLAAVGRAIKQKAG